MERGNLRTGAKGEYQVEKPQGTEYRYSHRGRGACSSEDAFRKESRAKKSQYPSKVNKST